MQSPTTRIHIGLYYYDTIAIPVNILGERKQETIILGPGS
jgi:hypothetical protein